MDGNYLYRIKLPVIWWESDIFVIDTGKKVFLAVARVKTPLLLIAFINQISF